MTHLIVTLFKIKCKTIYLIYNLFLKVVGHFESDNGVTALVSEMKLNEFKEKIYVSRHFHFAKE